MFTKTFTRERHIEELRAELRGCLDVEEAEAIRAELEEILSNPDSIADDERLASLAQPGGSSCCGCFR